MSHCCFDVVCILLAVLFFEAQSSTKSNHDCPVRPVAAESGPPGDCQCSVLEEIHCRGLSAVPEVDVKALYVGRQTYRSLYLARQHIQLLPAAAFAGLNVRRIVLDFNPIGDRIDPRAFRGTVDVVDLARLGLVSRRRRTSYHTMGRRDSLAKSSRRRYFNISMRNNDETESHQMEATATYPKRMYTRNRRRHRQTASGRDWDFNANTTHDEAGSGQAEIAVADESRRYD